MRQWISKLGLKRLLCDQRGVTYVEYAILAAVVGAGGIGVWKAFESKVQNKVQQTADQIETAK
jgi:Flp pilus assembly pilin Flp